MPTDIAFHYLSISGALFSTMCGLCGMSNAQGSVVAVFVANTSIYRVVYCALHPSYMCNLSEQRRQFTKKTATSAQLHHVSLSSIASEVLDTLTYSSVRLQNPRFLALSAHFIAQAMEFGRARDVTFVQQELHWSIPTTVVEG